MDDKLGFLEGEPPVEEVTAAEEAPAEVEAAPEMEAAPEPDPEPAPEPEAPLAPEPAPDLQAALYTQNLRISRRFAEREYGKEAVAAVHAWAVSKCDADPAFNREMRASDDPYEAAKEAHDREQVLSVVNPRDLDAYKAWRAARDKAPAPPPPRSLATAPSAGAGGNAPAAIGGGEAFSAAFS